MSYFKPHPRFLFNGANEFRELLNKMGSTISINEKNSPVFAADNMILIGKIQGFLKEEKFAKLANKYFNNDPLHSSIIWRIHILSSAINSCKHLEGDFVEFGCYDAKVAEFLIEYNNLSDLNKNFFLYDVFDNPPTERGLLHSPKLYENVKKRMSKYNFVQIIPGLLPKTFKDNMPEKIAFAHLDLNSAETEISLLDMFFEKVVSGGVIILDDYGTMGYEEQYSEEKNFFNNLGYSVFEFPTGSGMVIKR
tara:strand:- start:1309 stop:2058 length:750 start_codon:yes stop_codon:yes gene_type:complete